MRILKLILLFGIICLFLSLIISGDIEGGLATILVALALGIFGIFQNWARSQFYYPELNIEFNVVQPDSHKTQIDFKNKGGNIIATSDCYYYRLKIFNKGNYRAEKVEVTILEKYSQKNTREFVKDKNFLPMNLKWSHDRVIIRESIASSLPRHCDFGCVVHPNYKNYHMGRFSDIGSENKVVMCLALEVYPNTGSHLVFPGKHRFKIVATADNSRVTSKIFEIEFNDFWSDDEEIMLRKGLTVKEIKSWIK